MRRLLDYGLAMALMMAAAGPTLAQTSGKGFPAKDLLTGPADPAAYYADGQAAAALIEQKRWAEAEVLLRRLTAAYPYDTAYVSSAANWGRLGLVLRQQGECVEAILAYRQAIALQGPGPGYSGPSNPRYWIAACQTKLGQTDQALDTLRQMVMVDHFLVRPDLLEDAEFVALRADPRFRALAGKINTLNLDRVQGWRGDIDYFVAELRRSNPTGAAIDQDFFRRAEALKAAVPQLNDQQVAIGLMRVMAPLDRGHTAVWLGAPGARAGLEFKPMPIRLYQFPEGLFITEAGAGHEELVGAQVLKLGSATAEKALADIGESMSTESPAETLAIGPGMLLQRPGVLRGLGYTSEIDRAELTLRLANGKVVTRTIRAVDEPPRTDWSRRLNPPVAVKPPLFLSQIRQNHWFEFLPEHDAVYVQVSNILPDPDETLPQFGLRLRKALAEHDVHNLIIDIRHNNGGNTFTYVELLRTLTAFSAQDSHKVYAVIGRGVYSAAANFTTDLERLVKPVFVGEPTGGTGNQWGDESTFVLPWSGLMGAFSGVRWQLSNPWDHRRSIAPQVPVQLTASDYFAGRDPVVEIIFKMIDQDRPAH